MNTYKKIFNFVAIFGLILPFLAFAQNAPITSVYYTAGDAQTMPANNDYYNNINNNQNNGNAVQIITPGQALSDIFGVNIKSKEQRDAEKAAQKQKEDLALAQDAENARLARNNDGTFAYGYTNASGSQYSNGASYVDARSTNIKNRNTASAGSALSKGFLPTTFLGWVLAILLLSILVAVMRALIDKSNNKKRYIAVS